MYLTHPSQPATHNSTSPDTARSFHHPLLANVRKIAVLRANAIGDFVFGLPALGALRAAYPHAHITYIGQEWHGRFLKERPGAYDRVVVAPPSRGITEPEESDRGDPDEMEAFFAEMRREQFDLALQLHGGGRYSNPFVRRLGARVTAGLRTPDAEPLDLWTPYIYFQPEILRYMEAVSLVGARSFDIEPRLAVTAADLEEAYNTVPTTPQPLVAIHPGGGGRMRWWPARKFAQVGDALARAGAQVIVTGARPEEREQVGDVVRQMREGAIELWGRMSLGGLAGLLSRCAVVVGNDSGPVHLAGAVGARTVPIYWCGNMLTAQPTTRARHRPAISWRVACPVCGRDMILDPCDHEVSFVADVPAEEVARSALELLEDYLSSRDAHGTHPAASRLTHPDASAQYAV